MKITRASVNRAIRDDMWSLGNQVLYDLCTRHPGHDSDAEVVAKVWLIGRAYSAALERGKGGGAHGTSSNDEFYTKALPTAMRTPKFGQALQRLSKLKAVDGTNVSPILAAHGRLVRVFRGLTGKDKRSLASKYLHFHYPDLFFIYDSRAAEAVRALGLPPQPVNPPRGADPAYAQFVGAALGVRKHVAAKFHVSLSPRQLDRLLLGTTAP